MKRFVKTKEPLLGLPKGFTEVEYLQSLDVNNYAIDTGIIGHDGIESEVCVWFDSQVNNQCVLGSWSNASKRAWLCYTFGKKWYIGYVGTNQTTMDLVANQWNYVKTTIDTSGTQGKATLTVNDEVAGTVSYTKNWNNGVNLTLFRMNNDTGGDYYGSSCKVSLCKLWDNGVLVRHFVPCLDPAGTPCMYDKVERKAYYNTASGTFQYGKQIIPVEYLESTGTQWIDTNFTAVPTDNYTIEEDIEWTSWDNGYTPSFNAVEGLTDNNNQAFFGPQGKNETNRFYYGLNYGGVTYTEAGYTGLNERHVYQLIRDNGRSRLLKDGTEMYNGEKTGPTINQYRIFGCLLYAGSGYAANYVKIYKARFIKNNKLVKDLIPAIDEDNTGYMFDRISHTFYVNGGTGDFLYGEKVYAHKLRLIEENTQLNGLPSGLKEVEYLESDGNQYIDTGIIGGSKSRIYVCASSDNTSYNMALIGARDASTYNYSFVLWQRATTTNVRFDYSDSTNNSISVAGWDTTKPNTMEKDAEKNYLNGVQQTSNNTKTFNCNYSFYLFGLNTGGTGETAGTQFTGKIYSCKIWDDGTLVRDFVPVITTDTNKPGMYDKVSGKLFTNKGTGTDFTYGHKIIPVEYIESTGTQYIDMGFKPNQDTRITADFEYTQEPNNKGFIFGAGISATSTAFEFYPWGASWNSPYNNTNIQIASGLSSMAGQKFHLDKNKNVLDVIYEDGTVKNSSATYATFETTRTLWLFAINRGSMEATYFSNCVKLYNCQIYDNDKLIYDLIPVIDENNVGYMFDKLSHSLYVNASADPFVYGNKIYSNKKRMRFSADPWFTKDYELATYLQSSGNAYIDTGYNIVTSTDEVEMDYELLSDTVYKWIFGEHDNNARFGIGSGDGEAKRNVVYGSTTAKAADKYFFNGKHHYSATTEGVYLDGTKAANYSSFSSTSTLYLFNLNLSGNDYCTSARIWKYAHKRNGQYLRYYLPAKRKSDNKYGMLDLVSRQFYPSIGSGDFTGE